MGTICSSKISGRQNPGLTVDAVIIISEFSDQSSPCLMENGHQTEVLLEAFSSTVFIKYPTVFWQTILPFFVHAHSQRRLCDNSGFLC